MSIMPDDRSFCNQCFFEKYGMKKIAACFALAAFAFLTAGCERHATESTEPATVDRIVSTVPSITEVLFEIGVGDRIVGDSKFTVYPPETAEIEKIGGLYDVSLEKIVTLKPDLVVTLQEADSIRQRLSIFEIDTISVDHKTLEGVLESYEILGLRLGPEILETARQRRRELEERLRSFERKSRESETVRVLLCVDRSRGTGRIQNLYAVGTSPFYREVIRLAGGENVALETGLPFAGLDAEGIVHMAPDVIVELFTGEGAVAATQLNDDEKTHLIDAARQDWKTLPGRVPAVEKDRIFVITEDFATIPGPRTPLLVERLVEILDRCRE